MRPFALIVALAAALPVHASVGYSVSVERLTRASDAVVRGRVVKSTPQLSPDGRRVFTEVEIEISSVWSGDAPERLTIVVPGGIAGGIGQRVEGVPGFTEGEEVVVFAKKAGTRYHLQGLGQGKFSVRGRDARPNYSGLQFVRSPAISSGERRSEPMDVAELEQRVRSAR